MDAPRRSDRDPDAALRRLEERLNRASQRAERLFAEAAQSARGTQSRESDSRAAGAHKPPPAGWQAPREEHGGSRGDLELLVQVIDSLRDLIPPELQRRLADAVREVLLAVRALIDWYLERTERSRREPADVEDIPIL